MDSTNTVAQSLMDAGAAEGTVVFAQHQTAGRGQQGSAWHAAPGQNLTFSLILRPDFLTPKQVFLLSKLVACALRDTVAALLPDHAVRIKWPNDILVEGHKVAGILIETSMDQHRLRSMIVGIGLNVNQRAFDAGLHGRATSLLLEGGQEHAPKQVLNRLLEAIEAMYLGLRAGKSDGIERAYLQHLHGYQEDVLVTTPGADGAFQAHLVGVNPDGRLALLHGGAMHLYGVKEVSFVL